MDLKKELSERILVLDGAMGSMIQSLALSEEDFHSGLTPQGVELKGNNECLNLSHPEIISDIHRQYIEAGADIIETNSFSANRISQRGFKCESIAAEMAFESARIARDAVAGSGRRVLVAGSVGPTGSSLTLAQDIARPAEREFGFEEMKDVFREQMDALVRGGVNYIQLETCFDALTAKCAIAALDSIGNPVPLVISATVSDRSGRTLTGQTLEAFYRSVCYAPSLAAFGINCALGAREMVHLVRDIAAFSHHPLVFYPNAGMPDECGRYSETPDVLEEVSGMLASEGLLNIVGGCCGTEPEHIASVCRAVRGLRPRVPEAENGGLLTVSGLEAYSIDRNVSFTNIGERTNVAGSRKFARLIAGGQYEEALQVAAAQIEGGANIIDINMDDAMLDSAVEMRTFLRYAASDPAVAKAAVMIDSSHFETIVEGLRNAQGKCIVNSISLKDGEEEFLRRAAVVKSYGAAMVVMAFDEEGQAETYQRKIDICARCYRLLTERAGIAPSDIIFDVNVLSVGTGIAEHSRFGADFIEAVRWIKRNLPGALASGGISNLSFAFRGNNVVREAMHSAFLYHAVAAGLDMAIVNPQMLQIYDEIDPELLQRIEDVILDRRPDATARLVEIAETVGSQASDNGTPDSCESVLTPAERLQRALVKGDGTGLYEDVMECMRQSGRAIDVIEGPLVGGMEKVGGLFAEGKMFLPQIVRSAKIMKDAVSILQPFIDIENEEGNRPRIVMATVRGDVHDIGKNIVATVLQCSGFDVTDLGVMVPAEEIVAEACRIDADIIAVSGLITPSLARMEELCRLMSDRHMDIPLFVGGAAASSVFTSVRLAPVYDNVHYRADASATAVMAKRYIASPQEFVVSERVEQEKVRNLYNAAGTANVPDNKEISTGDASAFLHGEPMHGMEMTECSAESFIDRFDWKLFATVCGTSRDRQLFRNEAIAVLKDTRLRVRYCARFIPCCRNCDDEIVGDGFSLPMLRQSGDGYSLADFIPSDRMGFRSQFGLFGVCVDGIPDTPDNLVLHSVKVALAETVSGWMREEFASLVPDGYKVIMPAVGYACCPDHSLKRDVLTNLPDIGISLTESCSMMPEASICGFVIAHRNAAYRDIRNVSREQAAAYSAKRGFTYEEEKLFIGHLV